MLFSFIIFIFKSSFFNRRVHFKCLIFFSNFNLFIYLFINNDIIKYVTLNDDIDTKILHEKIWALISLKCLFLIN